MKLKGKSLEKNGEGYVKLIPEEPEDIWHVYNMIASGDLVTCKTFRKVQRETDTGSTTSTKQKISVKLQVEDIEYDAEASEIRIKGKNSEENRFIKLGQYHTIELGLCRSFTLWKPQWDVFYLERLDISLDPSTRAEVSAILLEPGKALLFLITSHMTIMVSKVEHNIPRKRQLSTKSHDKALKKFYGMVVEAMERHFKLDIVKCVVVASAGFVKDEYMMEMKKIASDSGNRTLLDNMSKFLLVSSSSGHEQALKTIMQDPIILSQITDTKASKDVLALQHFYDVMRRSPDSAYYGLEHCQRAAAEKAIESLLLSDALFRSEDSRNRKVYIELVESVRDGGGEVFIFSSMHPSGKQLDKMTGVAAVLRYPIPEISE